MKVFCCYFFEEKKNKQNKQKKLKKNKQTEFNYIFCEDSIIGNLYEWSKLFVRKKDSILHVDFQDDKRKMWNVFVENLGKIGKSHYY